MALEAYQMEGEEMYNQLAMLNQADATEYQRMYDSWSANFSNAQNMYQNEYGAWHDGVNNAISSAGLQLQEHGQLYDQAYSTYNAVANNAQNMYQNEYTKWQDEVNNALSYANLANNNYWDAVNFNENVRQHNESLAQKKSAAMTAESSTGISVDNIPSTVSKKASNFANNGELEEYLDSQVNNGILTEEEADYLYSTNRNVEQADVADRSWTLVDDGGTNWFWGIDGNASAQDQYGNTYTMDDLYDELKKTMSASDAKDYIKNLQKELGM
jgi:hypothetical protein